MNTQERRALLDSLHGVALDAGRAILAHYADEIAIDITADRSPVTEADRAAEAVILAGLARLAPAIPVVAEEQAAAMGLPTDAARRFFLVDPLDGTREFLKRNGEFTVNIALIEDGRPTLGTVHLPALGLTYRGADGEAHAIDAAGRRAIRARAASPEGLTVLISRSHLDKEATDAFMKTIAVKETVIAGSSLKFGRIAEGRGDLYVRLGRTMEWDTAAGHAVLEAAGGSVRTMDGASLGYGKPGFENPHFLARGAG